MSTFVVQRLNYPLQVGRGGPHWVVEGEYLGEVLQVDEVEVSGNFEVSVAHEWVPAFASSQHSGDLSVGDLGELLLVELRVVREVCVRLNKVSFHTLQVLR